MLALRLPSAIETRLDILAKSTGRTKSYYAREAIERYLKENEWQIQDIALAVEDADRPDAKFADHEGVANWLKSWGTDHELEPPVCG